VYARQSLAASDDRIEHRLRVCLGLSDRAQDLTRRSLLVERRRQLAIAGLQLIEQPHVLDGDHGLMGERLEQSDLPVGEEPDVGVAERDHADRDTFSNKGYAEERSEAQAPCLLAALRKLVRLHLPVSDVDDSAAQHGSAREAPADQREGELADHPGGNRAVMGDAAQPITVQAEDGRV
jgi:hypothetical protein